MSRNQVAPESIVASLAIAAIVSGVAFIAVRPFVVLPASSQAIDSARTSRVDKEAVGQGQLRMSDEDIIVSAASKLGDQVVKDFKGDFGALRARFGSALFLAVNRERAEGGYAILVVNMMDYARDCMTAEEHSLFRRHCGDGLKMWFSADANIIEMIAD